jgi:hypothetical protein
VPPVPVAVVQTPFEQVPLQTWLQPPQLAALVIVSTQAFEQSICPATEQPQLPALQTAPAGQALQPPQWSASPPVVGTQAPSEHCVSPAPQLVWQLLAVHTWPAAHIVEQPPQCAALGDTQLPLHASRPELQRHWPAWQVCPAAQAFPQAPQFCWSVATVLHSPEHVCCPAVQFGDWLSILP